MSATVEKPPPANHTVQRLLALPPGEAFIFYRGDLAADVASSRGVQNYARLLADVDAAARELQRMGRIAISERRIGMNKHGQRFTITEYPALGLVTPPARDDNDYSGAVPGEAAAA
jgi:hypothetical protein